MDNVPRDPDRPSVADLDEALRTYRRLAVIVPVMVIGGIAAVIGLSYLGTYLAPPYGVYYLGWRLSEWGLVGLLVVLVLYLWTTGRKLGRLLDDRTLLAFPIIGILSGLSVVAQHANARGLEWSGFLGPLRPIGR